MKVQFIKNYFRSYNNRQFRKYNVIPVTYSKLFNAYLYLTRFNLYIIPKEYVKVYKH